jgi:next-to-BRCA1 protein 1
MASSAPSSPDTPVTLKVNYDGATRRFKVPLRELGANSLENKLRGFLHIPFGVTITTERYSDSASTYVVLDPNNVPVFKQLYRAAKAKHKLKLRVTTSIETEEDSGPKPVTVEDAPDQEVESPSEVEPKSEPEVEKEIEPAEQISAPVPDLPVTSDGPPSGTIGTIVAPQVPEEFPDFIKEWRTRGMPRIHLRRNGEGIEMIDFIGSSSSTTEPMVTLEPLTLSSSSQYRFSETASKLPLGDLIREAREKELAADRAKAIAEKLEAHARMAKHMSQLSKDQSRIKARTAADAAIKAASSDNIKETVADLPSCLRRQFTVCCNSCDQPVPDAHFHCSTCDDGDFDLCQDCINRGITCYDEGHWLIKRTIKDGQINNSTTHIAPKKARIPTPGPSLPIRTAERVEEAPTQKPNPVPWCPSFLARTCNCCVQEFPEKEFVHCTSCDDYDLCQGCFAKDQHGHHPKHGFTAVVPGTAFEHAVSSRLSPGRNVMHNAICDGCDKYIRGVRHKCLDCPDWDYCAECVHDAGFVHPAHRFVAIFEPIGNPSTRSVGRSTHVGICCDGPLCTSAHSGSRYIVGIRYKCAICHDVDFCANCEASPANTHNKTHPLIKFKTPVRSVSVTTTGEHEDGKRLPTMGDRSRRFRITSNRATETSHVRDSCAATAVQTVVDVKPVETIKSELVEVKKERADSEAATLVEEKRPSSSSAELVAVFKYDTVADGTVLPPNHTFEQTWVLKNDGTVPWPAGCAVKFVGGDYMGAVDPNRPARIHELVSASESTICYGSLQPGQEFPFTVLMRTPERDGKVISYWRLTSPDGVKFGHKLWCDVAVQAPQPKVETTPEPTSEVITPAVGKSQMIIPKLEHESPSASIHEEPQPEADEVQSETENPLTSGQQQIEDDFLDVSGDEWAEDSDEGFMTDEEYDILDASDEEYDGERQKLVSNK